MWLFFTLEKIRLISLFSKKMEQANIRLLHFGTAEGIRTPDLLVRSQTLYPTELQPHTVRNSFPLNSLIIIACVF